MILCAATMETRMHTRCVSNQNAVFNRLERLHDAAGGVFPDYQHLNTLAEAEDLERELIIRAAARKKADAARKEEAKRRLMAMRQPRPPAPPFNLEAAMADMAARMASQGASSEAT